MMDRPSLINMLRYFLLGISLLFAASCKNSRSLSRTDAADSTFANTDQNKLAWEYKKRERLYKKQQRQGGRLVIGKRSSRSAPKHLHADIAKVIETARSFRGTPYKYGGTTRIGMDCSGLLCTSFRSINVNLPRTSNEQSLFGEPVRVRDLREGDLVFFSDAKISGKITHVGLVTAVKSREEIYFIHASTRLGVVEDNFFTEHYQRIFVKAVRPKI